jgi:hypothetical protein
MTRGTAIILANWKSFIIFGLSHMNLYFESGDERRKIMGPDREAEGYLCPRCESLFVPNIEDGKAAG